MERIGCNQLRDLIADPLEAVERYLPRTGTIAFGGMSGSSVPKEFPRAMAQHLSQDQGYSLTLLTGGATSEEFESTISKVAQVFRGRYPFLSGGIHRTLANQNRLRFFDYGLNKFNRMVRTGGFGEIELVVVEATGILEDCSIIPSLSLDSSMSFIHVAKKVIIEVNYNKPRLDGLHDIYMGDSPIPLTNVSQRIGDTRFKLPLSKIGAIILSHGEEGSPGSYKSPSEMEERISENIMDFLIKEVKRGFSRDLYGKGKLVIQPGAGSLASALADKFSEYNFRSSVWAETLSVKWALLTGELIQEVSSSALYILHGEEKFLQEFYEKGFENVVLRGQNVTNNPEVIQRLNLVSILQAINLDIYGNANISHIHGAVHNGVGGSVDFAPNAYITLIALPSLTSDGKISRIVPVSTHIDIPEHYIDVVITEQGFADLRGKSPAERAEEIINKCAHPKFKDSLLEYYERVRELGHEGHDLRFAHELFGESL